MRLAITGATGFIGKSLVSMALSSGHLVKALTRSAQTPQERLRWVHGNLNDIRALETLVKGADAVIHVAGVLTADDKAGFIAGNVTGTRNMLDVTKAAGISRFVHVSSLSAREPELSLYGWSKLEGEKLVSCSELDWVAVRPSGVYGPGDMELREMFRMAKLGYVILPPNGLLSLIEVSDVARLLLSLAETTGHNTVYEADDGVALTHDELIALVGRAVGKKARPIHLSRGFMQLAAMLDVLIRGKSAKLTPDRVGYLCHSDWTGDLARRPPADLWSPLIGPAKGLAETAKWYRESNLL